METIYLDNNATTPTLPAVWEAMRPYLHSLPGKGTAGYFGNPSSTHTLGKQAHEAVESCGREQPQ